MPCVLCDRGWTFFLFPHDLTFSSHSNQYDLRCAPSFSVVFKLGVCVCFNRRPFLSVFQKAVEEEEEESQVRKTSADLCSPGSKLTDADPARKVGLLPFQPSLLPLLSSPSPFFTHSSSLRVTTSTLTDRHTHCSPIHSGTLLLSDLSGNTLNHTHTHTHTSYCSTNQLYMHTRGRSSSYLSLFSNMCTHGNSLSPCRCLYG